MFYNLVDAVNEALESYNMWNDALQKYLKNNIINFRRAVADILEAERVKAKEKYEDALEDLKEYINEVIEGVQI